MNEKERQEFIKKEIEAIYEEFNAYVNQLNILKPFFQNLVDVANGANTIYELNEVIKKSK